MVLMRRPLLLVGALAVIGARARAQVRPDRPETPEVRAAATVRRSVQPDLATITLQFTADGATPGQAGNRLAARADALRRALGTLGLARDSLVNRSRWYWWNGRVEVVPGPERCVPRCDVLHTVVRDTTYRAHDAIEVRIRDLSKVGAVLDTAMGRGITDISDVHFSATDVTGTQEEALREATVRAHRQAEAIAAASGCQLGRVLSLSTQSDYAERYRFDDYLRMEGAGAAGTVGEASPTVVVQPFVPLSVTVFGRWELITKQP